MHEREAGAPTTAADSPQAERDALPARGLYLVASPGLPPEEVPVVGLDRPLQIGRAEGVVLQDPKLSRAHCSLFPVGRSGAHGIRDLSSRNGTFVNGRRVQEQRLRPADVIRVGDSLLVYNFTPEDAAPEPAPPGLIGGSASIRGILQAIARLGPTDLAILVEGETGTGKELVAQAVHARSRRRGPLVALNVAALPETLFESEVFGHVRGAFTGASTDARGLVTSADRGTLFLDEIGELAPALQAKLLRVLEQKSVRPVGSAREIPVDVRVVAATNAHLRDAVSRGTFRADLYARLCEARIRLPALRERPEDVPALVRHFLRDVGADPGRRLAPDVVEALLLHRWPFNVRELRSLVRSLAALEGDAAAWRLRLLPEEVQAQVREGRTKVEESDPAEVRPRPAADRSPHPEPVAPTEGELRELLVRHAGNVKEVALALGRDRTQIYRWLRRSGLDPALYRGRRSQP